MIFLTEKILKGRIVVRTAKQKELTAFGLELPKNSQVFFALHERNIVGICRCRIEPKRREGIISAIEVSKGFKTKGIGHKLLGKAHAYFEKNGIKRSSVVPDKKPKKFYQKAGYTQLSKKSQRIFRISPKVRRRHKK